MATVRNTTAFRIFSTPLDRTVEGFEVIDGITDDVADLVCATGVFERGVLVAKESPAPEPEPEPEPDEEEEQKPKRGRPRTVRGSVEVEEVVEEERETRA